MAPNGRFLVPTGQPIRVGLAGGGVATAPSLANVCASLSSVGFSVWAMTTGGLL